MGFLFQVKIDSVDVSRYCQPFEILESKDNNITSILLTFVKPVENIVTMQQLKHIEIWRGTVTATDEKVFDGFITNVKTDGLRYFVTGGDKLYRAVNATVNQIYALTSPQAGVISEIFEDLINTYTLLTANSSTVQDSGTVNIIEKFKVKRKSVYDAAKKLADVLGWQFYYRPDTDLVYFEPKGSTLNANILEVGGNVIALPKWEEDNSEYFNDIYVTGSPQAVSYTDTYVGDGTTATFSITRGKPINTEVLVASVLKKGGLTTATADAQYLVDADAQLITFTAGNIPTGGQAITINYSYNVSLAVHAFRQASIDQYGETVTRPFTFPEIVNMADLKQKAESLLDLHTVPFLMTTLKVGSQFVTGLGLRVGQRIRVIDTKSKIAGATIDRELVILSKKMRFPSDYDEIVVGDKEWKTGDWEAGVEERLQKLLDESNESEEILLEILSLEHIIRLSRSSLTLTRYYINDSFILDHDINGLLYNANETDIYDDFESSANWGSFTGTATAANNDTVSTHYWVGSQGVNFSFNGAGSGSSTGVITTTKNLTAITGVATGQPTQGTAAFWCWTSDNPMNGISLRIGSSSGNRIQCAGTTFAQRMGASAAFDIDSNRTYILFDLDSPSAVVGTPAWSNATYSLLIFNATKAGNVTLDYMTLSKNNSLGLNGLGNRITPRNVSTVVY